MQSWSPVGGASARIETTHLEKNGELHSPVDWLVRANQTHAVNSTRQSWAWSSA